MFKSHFKISERSVIISSCLFLLYGCAAFDTIDSPNITGTLAGYTIDGSNLIATVEAYNKSDDCKAKDVRLIVETEIFFDEINHSETRDKQFHFGSVPSHSTERGTITLNFDDYEIKEENIQFVRFKDINWEVDLLDDPLGMRRIFFGKCS